MVDDALPSGVRVFVVQVYLEAILASHRGQPLVERDPHVVLGEHLEVAWVVDPADIGGKIRSGVTNSTLAPARASTSASVHAGVLAVVVVEQHVALARNEPLSTSQPSDTRCDPR